MLLRTMGFPEAIRHAKQKLCGPRNRDSNYKRKEWGISNIRNDGDGEKTRQIWNE